MKVYRGSRDQAPNYKLAAGMFESLLDRLPESGRREGVLYFQGDAYLQFKNYHDAETAFDEYLARYASGRFRAEVGQGLMRIDAERSEPDPAALERIEAAKNDRLLLLELEKEHPTDPRVKYLLGNILYELGHYEQAGQKYFEATTLSAAFDSQELIRRRLAVGSDGEPTTRTPEELQAIARDADPLEVYDVYNYNARNTRGDFGARQAYAVVTGKVRNRGSVARHNVVIEVRFLNARNNILDAQRVRIGTLYPGEAGSFLARAHNFDSLFNIEKVDFIARSGQ